uniref:NADH-ubiquinone oxidoreductase chain 4 n=1 Tax=Malcus inconspicuus TaxID=498929 RepID=B7SMG1_9HEMI|nr:NADH dehydrogenase subunit 4 [Malcus inconspicuus]ABZ02055.1 NADH dehydrogenase subunit 4 [Malcus inconspicuus]
MMKFLLMIVFLIPLSNSYWMMMYALMFIMLSFMFMTLIPYWSSLSYGYGIDVIFYWMIMLTFWISILMIMASYKIKSSLTMNNFLFMILFLMFFLFLSFSCTNFFLFYLFFESSIVPTVILIFGWGYQPERLKAGIYLIMYTLFASLPLLIGIFYIMFKNNTCFYPLIDLQFNLYLYLSLIMAFLVKMPMFFVHFWLPKAHVEAPVSGSMILAGVLLKLGGYGLLRIFNFMTNYIIYNYIWIIISLFGSVMVSFFCLFQVDIKSLIAYSSVSHMGLVIGGIMTCNYLGLSGSLVMMLGHGLCSSGLFVLANLIYERSYSRSIFINKGYMTLMPNLSFFWFIFSINNMSSPPSLNLLGELMLINSIVSWSKITMIFLAFSSFLSCGYSIYLYSITQHGCFHSGLKIINFINVREYTLLFFHFIPLNFFFLKGDLLITLF